MMMKFLFAVPAALILAVPAHATGGVTCATAGSNRVEMSAVISHTAIPSVVSARLTDGGRGVPVRVAQSWLTPTQFLIDLVDPNAMRHEMRLSVRKNGRTYDGSLWRGGKRHWVRCREA